MEASKPVFKVFVVSAEGLHKSYVEAYEFSIGRSADADLVIQHEKISRTHANVIHKDGAIFIQDNHSSLGTYINGKKISADRPTRYRPGESIRFGDVPIIVSVRVLPHVEIKHLKEVGNSLFNQRYVKNELNKTLGEIVKKIQNKPTDYEDAETQSIKTYLEAEKEFEDNLKKLLNQSSKISEQNIEACQKDIERLISYANNLAKEQLDQAKEDVKIYIEKTKQKGDEKYLQATQYADQKKMEILKAAQQQAESLEAEAITKAKARAAEIESEALEQKEEVLNHAQVKVSEIKESAESEKQKIIEAGRQAIAEEERSAHESLSLVKADIEKCESELESLKEDLGKQEDILAEKRNEIIQKAEKEAEERKIQLLEVAEDEAKQAAEKMSESYRQEHKNLSDELESLKSSLSNLQTNITDLNNQKLNLEKEEAEHLERIKKEEAEHSDKLNKEKEEQFERLKQERADHTQKLKAEQEKIIADYADQIKSSKADISKLENQKNELSSDVTQMTKDYEALKLKYDVHKKEFDSEIEEKRNKNEKYFIEVQQKQKELEELKVQCDEVLRKYNDLLSKIESSNSELKKGNQGVDTVKKQIEVLENEKSQLQQESSNLKENIETERAAILEGANSQAELILHAAKEEVSQMKAEAQEEVLKLIAEAKDKQEQEWKLVEEEAAARRFKANKEANKLIEAQVKANKKNRQQEIQEISFELQGGLKPFLEQSTRLNDAEKELVTERVLDITIAVLNGESVESEYRLKDLLGYKASQSLKIKRFWRNVGIVASVFCLFVLSYFIFPEEYSAVKKNLLVDFENNMASKSSMQDHYAKEVLKKKQEERIFKPKMTPHFKESYTDNVVYTLSYVDLVSSEEYQKRWILRLHDLFVKDLGLEEVDVARFVSEENKLTKNLIRMREDINAKHADAAIERLREEENLHVKKMKKLIGKKSSYKKFWALKRQFFTDYDLGR